MCNLKITSPLCLLPTGAGLLKSLSPKRESQSAAEDKTRRRREKRGREEREGLGWKMEHKWEGRDGVRAKEEEKGESWERCGTDESFERVRMSSQSCRDCRVGQTTMLSTVPSPHASEPAGLSAMPLHTYLAPRPLLVLVLQ